MTENQIIKYLVEEHTRNILQYTSMLNYWNGEHDICSSYRIEVNRSNDITVCNYVQKLINNEVSYTLGNAVNYISKSDDKDIINQIENSLAHFSAKHDQEVLRQSEIFGESYELAYINRDGEFCCKILNPLNAIVYCDADNKPIIFIHFYKERFTEDYFYDVYTNNSIVTYKDNIAIGQPRPNIFNRVPVGICTIGREQTIYNKIKTLNDNYNHLLSDQQNIISEFRNAFLTVTGMTLTEETAKLLKEKGILNLPTKDSKIEWLVKELNDQYIQNQIQNIRHEIYEQTGHIDGNEKLQSNLSSLALRSRLLFLEQRCQLLFDAITDTMIERLKMLFIYLSIKNQNYDYKDITVKFTPNIPQDILTIAQTINNLSDVLSTETKLSLLPFVENPTLEIEKIKKEQEQNQLIDLDKVGLADE